MSNSIAPGSSADVNVKVTALTTNPNVPVTYKTIILKKNLVNGVNTLTQEMMSAANTKYVIKYDYVLGSDITVPENCIFEFDGGSISANENNDTITGQNTGIQAGLVKIFNTNVTLSGSWNVVEAYPEWFGAKGDGVTDDTSAFQKAVYFSSVVLSNNYKLLNIIVSNNCTIYGNNHYILHSENASQDKHVFQIIRCKLKIYDIIIDGNYDNTIPSEGNIGYWALIWADINGSIEIYNSTLKNTRGYGLVLGSIFITKNRNEYAQDCIVQNCDIILANTPGVFSAQDCIRIEKCNGAKILNNRIIGGYAGIRSQFYCKDVDIIGNDIRFSSIDNGITAALGENYRIFDNYVSNSYGHGFEIDSVVNTDLHGNISEYNRNFGFLLSGFKPDSVSENEEGYISERYSDIPENHVTQDSLMFESRDVIMSDNISRYNTRFDSINGGYVTIRNNIFDNCYESNTERINVCLTGGPRNNSKNIRFESNTLVHHDGFKDLFIDQYQGASGFNNKVIGGVLNLNYPLMGENDIINFKDVACKNAIDPVDGNLVRSDRSADAYVAEFHEWYNGFAFIRFVVRANEDCQGILPVIQRIGSSGIVDNVWTGNLINITTDYKTFTYYMRKDIVDNNDYDYIFRLVYNNNNATLYISEFNIYVAGTGYKVDMIPL